MASQNIKSFLRALEHGTERIDLIAHAKQLYQIKQIMISTGAIPSSLSNHYNLGPLTNGTLVLLAENASVAAKLKHITPSILSRIQRTGWNITHIKIKLQKPDFANFLINDANQDQSAIYSSRQKPKKLSQASIDSLRHLEHSLPDSELKHSIQALLKNASKIIDCT